MSSVSTALLTTLLGGSFSPSASVSVAIHQRGGGSALLRSEGQSESHIINGTEITNEASKYSFFAMPTSNANSDEWLGCGASIISSTWGVTASHCFGGGNAPCSGPHTIKLWFGDLRLSGSGHLSGASGGQSGSVEAEITCHSQFDGKCSHGHDITLLKLKSALPSWVKPVKLNLDGTGVDTIGEETVNIGFGYRESTTDAKTISSVPPSMLREANLTIFADDYDACDKVYKGGYGCSDDDSIGEATNKDQQLCAGATNYPERDTCSGDSGSPMLDKNGVQIGIVSYGGGPGEKMTGAGRICADPEYMGVYSRISAFKTFICEHVTDIDECD